MEHNRIPFPLALFFVLFCAVFGWWVYQTEMRLNAIEARLPPPPERKG